MTSIPDSLSSLSTPQVAGQAARLLGMDEPNVQAGLNLAGPLLVGALGERAATPQGAASLFETLTRADAGGGLLGALASGDIGGLLKGAIGGAAGGELLTNDLLGSGRQAIERVVQERLGVDIGPILALAMPVVAGAVGKLIEERNLDAAGLADLLQGERQRLVAADPQTAGIVDSALLAGAAAQTEADRTVAVFTPDELAALTQAPARIGAMVVASSQNQAIGTAQELTALSQAMREGVRQAAPGSLLAALTAAIGESATRLTTREGVVAFTRGLPTAGSAGLDACRQVATILDAKARPEDAVAYKAFLLRIAGTVTSAAKEGGFLGIGGQAVSSQEQQTVARIAEALGVSA